MTYLVYLANFSTTHLGVVEPREEVIYGLDRYPSLKVWYTVHHQSLRTPHPHKCRVGLELEYFSNGHFSR